MIIHIDDVTEILKRAQQDYQQNVTREIMVGDERHTISTPFPSPGDWRDCWIYFLLLDRFNNPDHSPAGAWNRRYDFRQGEHSKECNHNSVIFGSWVSRLCGYLQY